MNALRNNKYIGWIVIVLAILNVVLLTFIWQGHQHSQRRGPGGGMKLLEEKLGLSESQKSELEQIRESHFSRMEELRTDSRQTRKALHDLWSETNSSQKVSELTEHLGKLQAAIEKATFEHFAEIRSICTPEQQKVFDNLIQDVLRQGDRPGPPNGRRPMRDGRRPGGPPPPMNGN